MDKQAKTDMVGKFCPKFGTRLEGRVVMCSVRETEDTSDMGVAVEVVDVMVPKHEVGQQVVGNYEDWGWTSMVWWLSHCGGQVLSWWCIWLMGMFVFCSMVGMSMDRASQWTVDMGTAVAKGASPVEGGNGWHFMEGLGWTGGGPQMLRRIRTKLERVGVPAGDQGKHVAIVRENN